jgi:hypothetical protein
MGNIYSVPPLRVARLMVELRPEQPLHLPLEHRGNVLRGAFGRIFQRQVCDPDCPGAATCLRREDCPYAQIFEPRWPDGASFGMETAPRGFLFRPPLSSDPEFGPHRAVRFELRLFGKGIEYAEHFLRAFRLFSQFGLADRAVHLRSVIALDWSGRTLASLVADGQPTNSRAVPLTLTGFFSEHIQVSEAAIEFVTPTWLREQGHDLRVPTFSGLVQRVRDRISMLSRIHEKAEWQADFRAIGQLADQAVTVDWDGRWVKPGRTSTRTGQTMPLGGFVGFVHCSGVDAALWPLLQMGQEVHAGRHAVWGQGWFRIQPCERGRKVTKPG